MNKALLEIILYQIHITFNIVLHLKSHQITMGISASEKRINWGQDIIYILKRTPDGAIQMLYLTPNGIEFILMNRVFCQNLL